MCMVSNVGDEWGGRWKEPYYIPTVAEPVVRWNFSEVTREEFEALKKEVEKMKKLLIKAKLYDIENGEPDCEMDDKVELLKRIAEAVGVDLTEVFGK